MRIKVGDKVRNIDDWSCSGVCEWKDSEFLLVKKDASRVPKIHRLIDWEKVPEEIKYWAVTYKRPDTLDWEICLYKNEDNAHRMHNTCLENGATAELHERTLVLST